MSKIFLLFSLLVMVYSCSNQDDTKKQEALRDSIKAANKKENLNKDSTIKTYEGVYIFNLNVNSFRDCNYPDSVYWVIDDTKKLENMYKNTIPVVNVYGSVYARVRGELTRTEEAKLIDTYPRTLHVKEVISVERKTSENTCVPYDFWATGNKQSWTLQISEKENLIELYIPSDTEIYYAFYAEPREDNDTIIYSSYNSVQRYVIEAKIWKEKCSDDVTGKIYEYSVVAEIRGKKKFKGCGIKGR